MYVHLYTYVLRIRTVLNTYTRTFSIRLISTLFDCNPRENYKNFVVGSYVGTSGY